MNEKIEETRQKSGGREGKREREEKKEVDHGVTLPLSLSLSDCWYAQSFLMLLAGLMPVSSFLFAIYCCCCRRSLPQRSLVTELEKKRKERKKIMYSRVVFSLSRCCRRRRRLRCP